MKKIYLLVFLFFLVKSLFSQRKYNKLSIEAGYGFNIPISPKDDISTSDYLLPNHVDLGVRYMFDEYFGLKMRYANDRFRDKKDKNIGNGYHRLGIEAVYNLSSRLDLFNNNFNILFHAGIGVTYAFPGAIKRFKNGGEFTFGLTPYNTKRYERIGNLIFGLTPQIRLSDDMALTFDMAYVVNTQQQYSYSGELLYINRRKVQGGFVNFTVGLQFYLGKERRHADWYYNSRKY
ncbi:hypothetical protein [Flavivirga algicola]|uniref:Outer membrane protein beta-barrel domain-containing protein n=1 Tax=Flavivirga algicola TaxID=2729136 RepID=A0ABX1RVP8_9FLAO|nr:hypothetical protein [Flavivirga algicola]NMH87627.1 hypothetical protein [Flavivirga algicola]